MKRQESPFGSGGDTDIIIAVTEDTAIDPTIDPTIIMAHATVTVLTIPHIITILTATIEGELASISESDSLKLLSHGAGPSVRIGSFLSSESEIIF